MVDPGMTCPGAASGDVAITTLASVAGAWAMLHLWGHLIARRLERNNAESNGRVERTTPVQETVTAALDRLFRHRQEQLTGEAVSLRQ